MYDKWFLSIHLGGRSLMIYLGWILHEDCMSSFRHAQKTCHGSPYLGDGHSTNWSGLYTSSQNRCTRANCFFRQDYNRARGYWWLPVGPHKAVAEISKIGNYRRGELSWCMDGRVNPLMGRKVLEGLSLSFSLLVSCSFLSNCLYLSLSVCLSLDLKTFQAFKDSPWHSTCTVAMSSFVLTSLTAEPTLDPPRHKTLEKTQSFAIFPPFRVPWSYVGYLFLFWLFLFSKCSRLCCFICPYCRKFDF